MWRCLSPVGFLINGYLSPLGAFLQRQHILSDQCWKHTPSCQRNRTKQNRGSKLRLFMTDSKGMTHLDGKKRASRWKGQTTGMKQTKRSAQVISEEGPHLKCTCLWGPRGLLGAFFIVLLFVTPLKMYMGITSKLNQKGKKRKHPLAVCWAVSYIVRYECTRDIWNTTKPPCTLFSLLQKTFLYGVVLHFFPFF